eukprot:INCI14661.1.p1 GENE.INCI14661.1~~INCI14661.1.p1  ORF type:complete len:508 (-),score=71.68 INCI14661.1:124-1647(-)
MVFSESDIERLLDKTDELFQQHVSKHTLEWAPVWQENDELERRLNAAGAQQGKLSCSITWNTRCNIGLFCTTPSRKTIFFGNRRDAGGALDVGNQNRSISTAITSAVENIYFAQPLPGRYVFEVRCSNDRSEQNLNTVQVRLKKAGAAWQDKFLHRLSHGERKVVFVVEWTTKDEKRASEPRRVSSPASASTNDDSELLCTEAVQSIAAQAEQSFRTAEYAAIKAVNAMLVDLWESRPDLIAPPPKVRLQSLVHSDHGSAAQLSMSSKCSVAFTKKKLRTFLSQTLQQATELALDTLLDDLQDQLQGILTQIREGQRVERVAREEDEQCQDIGTPVDALPPYESTHASGAVRHSTRPARLGESSSTVSPSVSPRVRGHARMAAIESDEELARQLHLENERTAQRMQDQEDRDRAMAVEIHRDDIANAHFRHIAAPRHPPRVPPRHDIGHRNRQEVQRAVESNSHFHTVTMRAQQDAHMHHARGPQGRHYTHRRRARRHMHDPDCNFL